MGKDVRDRELAQLALRCLIRVGCKGGDVDERGDPVVRPRVRDQGAAVRVADKDHGAADPPEAAGDALYVALQGVETVLRAHHFVPLGLKRWDQLLET